MWLLIIEYVFAIDRNVYLLTTREVFHHYDGKPQAENVARCYADKQGHSM